MISHNYTSGTSRTTAVQRMNDSKFYPALLSFLKEERLALGLSQKALATKLGRPQSYVGKVEVGDRRLDIYEFVVYCRALGVNSATVLNNVLKSVPV